MKTIALHLPPAARTSFLGALWQREPRLVLFAFLLFAAMLPAAIALGIDERVLRGVNVWVKPLKLMASIGLLALTTAWFIGHLPTDRRGSRAVNTIVWTVMLLGQTPPPTGPGLPITGCSMIGGDLRVAHFVGIHTAQVLPVFGAVVVALRLPAARAWVVIASIAWSLLFAFMFVQALQGHPFIAI